MRDYMLGESTWQSDLMYAPVYGQETSMVSSDILISEYRSGFDYFAFHRGNVSDLLEPTSSENIKLESQIVEGNLLITNSSKLTLSGQYVKADVVNGGEVTLETYPGGKVFEAGELNIVLEGYFDMDEIDFNQLRRQINLVATGDNLKSNIEFVHKDLDTYGQLGQLVSSVDLADRVYPNPVRGNFTIRGEDINSIVCYSIDGATLSTTLHHGYGQVTVTIEGDITGPILLRYSAGDTVYNECLISLPKE